MSQTFPDVPATTKLKDSRAPLLQRDEDLRSCFSGTSAPASPVEGQEYWNTTQGLLYRYISGNWVPQPYVADDEDLIINGNFEVWQRGTSSSASGYVAVDRWLNTLTGGTVTMSRQSFTVGDTLGSVVPSYFCRQAVSGQSAAGDNAIRTQRMESVNSYAGQDITICGFARRSAGAGDMDLEIQQNFGTGGSPSSTVNTRVGRATLGSSWAAFALPVSVPSIVGKTLGSSGDDFLSLNFWISAGSTFNTRTGSLGIQTVTVDLWGIHIRKGRLPVEAVQRYTPRPVGINRMLCERYYENGTHTMVLCADAASRDMQVRVPFRTRKRTSNGIIRTGSSFSNCADQAISTDQNGFQQTIRSNAAGQCSASYSWAQDSEL